MRDRRAMRSRPLVLVPGLGLGAEAWAPTLRALSPTRPVRVLPLPGYGVGGDGQLDLRPPALAERLLAELEPQPPDGTTAVLVGHSASCQIVAAAASLAPDRIRGLVLLGPTTDPRAATWHRLVGRWLATARHEDPRQVPALGRQYHRTGLATMARALDAARRDRIEQTLAGVACPVLVLRGRYDRICPEDWAAQLGDSERRSATTVPVGAHMLPLTHGERVAAHIEAWQLDRW